MYIYIYFIPLNTKHMTSEIDVFWGKEGFCVTIVRLTTHI